MRTLAMGGEKGRGRKDKKKVVAVEVWASNEAPN
jgi:hypothetical protein